MATWESSQRVNFPARRVSPVLPVSPVSLVLPVSRPPEPAAALNRVLAKAPPAAVRVCPT